MEATRANPTGGDTDPRDPFQVLGVPPSASAREIERAGQRLLAMISAGVADDCTPEAEHEIRHALDELRNARTRLVHEIGAYALGPETLGARAVESALVDLERALPGGDVRSHALAETLLWKELGAREPAAVPPDHAERKARAFASIHDAYTLADADWAETVMPPLPIKAKKRARKD